MLNNILFILIGAVAGVLSGFFGLGGGIIVIPSLIYLCGFTQLKAQGTSLAVLLPPVGLLAVMEYYKKGNIDVKAGAIICALMFFGAMFGAKLAPYVPENILRKSLSVLFGIMAIKLFWGK